MSLVRKEIEIAVSLPKQKDDLNAVLSLLAGHAIRVLSYTTYHEHGGLVLLAITDSPEQAHYVLRDTGYACQTSEVVVVGVTPYQPGMVARLGWLLNHAGIGIISSHLSSIGPDGFYAVFKTTNNRQAIAVLNTVAFESVA